VLPHGRMQSVKIRLSFRRSAATEKSCFYRDSYCAGFLTPLKIRNPPILLSARHYIVPITFYSPFSYSSRFLFITGSAAVCDFGAVDLFLRKILPFFPSIGQDFICMRKKQELWSLFIFFATDINTGQKNNFYYRAL